MFRRQRPHRKTGLKGSMITVGLGLVIIILLGYYVLQRADKDKPENSPAPVEQSK